MGAEREPWFPALQRLRHFWRSDAACAMCSKPERPWRRMMVFPLGGSFAFICSDHCWAQIESDTGDFA